MFGGDEEVANAAEVFFGGGGAVAGGEVLVEFVHHEDGDGVEREGVTVGEVLEE